MEYSADYAAWLGCPALTTGISISEFQSESYKLINALATHEKATEPKHPHLAMFSESCATMQRMLEGDDGVEPMEPHPRIDRANHAQENPTK